MKCDYCGEESDYKPIIMKPHQFVHAGRRYTLVSITDKSQDNVCLDCLNFEINELKEIG